MPLTLESSRHVPSAVALENMRIGGRHTECACYFGVKTSGIGLQPRNAMYRRLLPPMLIREAGASNAVCSEAGASEQVNSTLQNQGSKS